MRVATVGDVDAHRVSCAERARTARTPLSAGADPAADSRCDRADAVLDDGPSPLMKPATARAPRPANRARRTTTSASGEIAATPRRQAPHDGAGDGPHAPLQAQHPKPSGAAAASAAFPRATAAKWFFTPSPSFRTYSLNSASRPCATSRPCCLKYAAGSMDPAFAGSRRPDSNRGPLHYEWLRRALAVRRLLARLAQMPAQTRFPWFPADSAGGTRDTG
jgi:hypothetical protein